MTITLKISANTRAKMVEYFQDKKREKTPPYAVFQADEADTVVTLYESGKVVFQGVSADIDAAMWKQVEMNLNPSKKLKRKIAKTKRKMIKKRQMDLIPPFTMRIVLALTKWVPVITLDPSLYQALISPKRISHF